jgi:MFS family permease
MSEGERKRWALVSATGVLTGLGHGFGAFAVSALLKPLAVDLETGRGAVSMAIGLGRLVSGLSSPLVGRITDLHGPRLIVIGGMMLSAFGLFVLAFVQTELGLYAAWSLLFSAGTAAGFTVALDKLVVATAARKRGMALAVRFSISAVVATLIVPVVSLMVESIGWRQTCLAWAVILLLLIPIPAIWFRRELIAENVKGERPAPLASHASTVPPKSQSFLRDTNFWLIAVALCAQASVTTGLTVHLLPLMTDHGLDPVFAGTLFGAMILMTIPVRLLAGFVADRMHPRLLPALLSAGARTSVRARRRVRARNRRRCADGPRARHLQRTVRPVELRYDPGQPDDGPGAGDDARAGAGWLCPRFYRVVCPGHRWLRHSADCGRFDTWFRADTGTAVAGFTFAQ